jgi:hypothetical protein
LVKVGARYYDPQVGSFTTRDTYLDQKPYLYFEHDPVNGVDPSGHDGEDVGIAERLGQLASSGGGILLRGIMIFAPIWYGGVKVTHKFHDWMGRRYSHQKLSSHTSEGDIYGNSHEHQAKMIDTISDPDSR